MKGFFTRLRILAERLRASSKGQRLRVTREGKFFIGIALGVGFAAINTGNNLLYLLLGMLLALIIVSGILSDVSLRKLAVSRRLPLRAQVGRGHLVEIEVLNRKGRIPSYAIEVEDLRADQPADKRCFFLKISPQSTQVAAYRRTPTKRGRDAYVGFRIATRFPFGLFEKSREIAAPGELLIYPAVDPVNLPEPKNGRAETGARGHVRGYGEEVVGLRMMRTGEDPRDINWKKSASSGQLVVRERARAAQSEVLIALEDQVAEQPNTGWEEAFESRVREAASLAVAHLRRGDAVVVQTTSGAKARAHHDLGADIVLRFLALISPASPPAIPGAS